MLIPPTRYETDAELVKNIEREGSIEVLGFDPNLHLACVNETEAVLYREKRKPDNQFVVHLYRLDFAKGIVAQAEFPFLNLLPSDDGSGNIQVQVLGRFLAVRTNSHLRLLEGKNFSEVANFDPRPADPRTHVTIYQESDDGSVVMRTQGVKDLFQWLSVPDLKLQNELSIAGEQGFSLAAPGKQFVLRKESNFDGHVANGARILKRTAGILSYQGSGRRNSICTDAICQEGGQIKPLDDGTFVIFGNAGVSVLQTGPDGSGGTLSIVDAYTDHCTRDFSEVDKHTKVLISRVGFCSIVPKLSVISIYDLGKKTTISRFAVKHAVGWSEIIAMPGNESIALLSNNVIEFYAVDAADDTALR